MFLRHKVVACFVGFQGQPPGDLFVRLCVIYCLRFKIRGAKNAPFSLVRDDKSSAFREILFLFLCMIV